MLFKFKPKAQSLKLIDFFFFFIKQKIVSVQREIDSNRDINNKQKDLNEKANKAINNVKSNTKSLENDTLDQVK